MKVGDKKVGDKDMKININKNVDSSKTDPSEEDKAVAADAPKDNAELAKVTADLEELRQTLLRPLHRAVQVGRPLRHRVAQPAHIVRKTRARQRRINVHRHIH